MMRCPYCDQTFKDHVDFCFYDGEVLVAVAGAAESEALDAPAPPQRAQGSQGSATMPAPARSQKRRGLVGRGKMPVDPSDDPLQSEPPPEPVAEAEADAEADVDPKVAAAAPYVDPTAETPPPAPEAQGSPKKPFVNEDDTIPIPIPPKMQAQDAPAEHDAVPISDDPTQPPAPDRSSTPVPVPPSTTPAPVGEASQSKTPIVAPAERTEAPAGNGAASGAFVESSQVAPSTYAAAPPPVEGEAKQDDSQRMLVYGGMALVIALLLMGMVGVGVGALGLVGGEGSTAQTDTPGVEPVAPATPKPKPPTPQPAPVQPAAVPDPVEPAPVEPAPVEPPVPDPTEQPAPVPAEQPAPAPTEQPVPAPAEQPVPAPAEQPAPAPVPAPTPTPAPAPAAPVPAPAPTNDATADVDVAPKPEKGRVGFVTSPPGELYLSDEPVGQTNGLELTLAFGSYSYEVRLEGYESLKGTVVVDKAQLDTVRGELKPIPKQVVSVNVVGITGMRVLINGSEGKPPFRLELPVGPLEVKVYNPTTNIWEEQTVQIKADKPLINLNQVYPHLTDVQ